MYSECNHIFRVTVSSLFLSYDTEQDYLVDRSTKKSTGVWELTFRTLLSINVQPLPSTNFHGRDVKIEGPFLWLINDLFSLQKR